MKSPCSSQQGSTVLLLSASGRLCWWAPSAQSPQSCSGSGLQASATAAPSCQRAEGSRGQDGSEQDASFWFYFPVSMGLLGNVSWEGTPPRRSPPQVPHASPAHMARMLREAAGVCSTRGHRTASFRIMLLMNVSRTLAEKHPKPLALASLGFIPECFLSIYQSETGQTFPYEMLYFWYYHANRIEEDKKNANAVSFKFFFFFSSGDF